MSDARLGVVATAGMLASLTLPWAEYGLRDHRSIVGAELVSARLAVIALAVVGLVALLATQRWSTAARSVAAGCGVVAAVVGAAAILLAETATATLPRGVLPAALDRLGIGITAGSGLWLVSVSGVGLVVAASGVTSPLGLTGAGRRLLVHHVRERTAGAVLALAAAVLVVARYEPWAGAQAGPESMVIEGSAVPWFGMGTFVGVCALGLCAVVGVLRPGVAPALVGVFSAWAVSLLAAVAMLTSRLLSELRLSQVRASDSLPAAVREADPRVTSAHGPRLAFAAALLAGAASIRLLARSGRAAERAVPRAPR